MRTASGPCITIFLLPLIANTIDVRIERTVRLRERWLEFLLGASPKIEEYGLADEPALPLPVEFAEALKVDLGPALPSFPSRNTGQTAKEAVLFD